MMTSNAIHVIFQAGEDGYFEEEETFNTTCEYLNFNELFVPTSTDSLTRKRRSADNSTGNMQMWGGALCPTLFNTADNCLQFLVDVYEACVNRGFLYSTLELLIDVVLCEVLTHSQIKYTTVGCQC